MAAKFQEVS